MQVSCSIINDLLPLYVRTFCSTESRILVDEHLGTCLDCKKKLEIMKSKNNQKDATGNKLILKTKFNNMLPSLLCIVFYVFLIITLLISKFFQTKAEATYDIRYHFASTIIIMLTFFTLGLVVTYLGEYQRRPVKIIILEIIVIGMPSIFACLQYFLPFLNFNFYIFYIEYAEELYITGSILLGSEVFRIITLMRDKGMSDRVKTG